MPVFLRIPPVAAQPSGSPTLPLSRASNGSAAFSARPPNDLVVVRAVRTDVSRLRFRSRQIDLGKSTPEYAAYLAAVPKEEREASNVAHPVTPRAEEVCSKRSFDFIMKTWRRSLHSHWEVAGGASVSRSSSGEGEGCVEEKGQPKPNKLWSDFKGSWASECDEDPDFQDFDDEDI